MSRAVIGPTLPPNWNQTNETNESNESTGNESQDNDEESVFGPTLPPDYGCHSGSGANCEHKNEVSEQRAPKDRVIGPTLPKEYIARRSAPNDDDCDSDDMIGPIPQSHHKYEEMNKKFANCEQLLNRKDNERQEKRELWMTEVPKPLAAKFTTKSVKHFSQRPVKRDDKNERNKYKRDDKRDQELSELMDSYNKHQKRDSSLLEIHGKESKKAKKLEKKEEERVAFDPDKDLAVRRMDSRQTKSVLNKAKQFNDRFSLGINKFL